MKRLFFVAAVLFPLGAFAQVSITEIMYDPKDADASSGGEWIEVYNGGTAPVDLTKWVFFEADTNHGIATDGSPEIPAGEYAVISRDSTAFKNHFSNFIGLLFKASFALNDSETLALKSGKEAQIEDSVTYTSEWGAKNDGNSIQKIEGEWKGAAPTPGASNNSQRLEVKPPNMENQAPGGSTPAASSGGAGPDPFALEVRIRERAATATVGAGTVFEAYAFGSKKELLANARYVWNFGDGATREGKNVAHVFRYPGEYIVMVSASSGENMGTARISVVAHSANVVIVGIGVAADFYIELKNNSPFELDLSGWLLQYGSEFFTLPKNTFLAHGASVRFAPSVTEFSYNNSAAQMKLLYPNSVLAHAFSESAQSPSSPPLPQNPEKNLSTSDVDRLKGGTTNTNQGTLDVPRVAKSVFVEDVATSVAPATVFVAKRQSENSRYWYFASAVGLTLLGAFAAFVSRRAKNLADEFEIIEIKDEA